MQNQFKGKKIAVIGLSVEGLASMEYLSSQGGFITGCDQKDNEKLHTVFVNRLKIKNINLKLGKNYLEGLDKYDLIVRTPGFPLWNTHLQKAIKQGKKVTSQTQLFLELCRGKIIGVTGTKGKGTTATIIYTILKNSAKDVFLGGNIGTPPFSFLQKVTKDTWVVLELSSFQLEDVTISPHISVILNITSEHLYSASWENPNYHLTKEEYKQAKINILRFQKKSDFAVLNRDYEFSYSLNAFTLADIWMFSRMKKVVNGAFVKDNKIFLSAYGKLIFICDVSKIQLRGAHNLENITAAITASSIAGADTKIFAKTITSFKPLEHRLEYVATRSKIQFYNDSFSTTPETTIAALKSFTEPLILICGGSEKNSDYNELGKEIIKSKNIKAIILIGSTASKIKQSVLNATKKLIKSAPQIIDGPNNMKDIVNLAVKLAIEGDIVLLSPACASFDMFKNYKERGTLFKKTVFSLL